MILSYPAERGRLLLKEGLAKGKTAKEYICFSLRIPLFPHMWSGE
jgi:hypothetical protein